MKRNTSILIGAALLVAFAATETAAQGVVTRQYRTQPQAWLGFSFEPIQIGARGNRTPAIVIREVVEDSPSERAGLTVNDTVLTINDIRVTESFMSSLSGTLVAGDRVRLKVRRAGRDRDFVIEAAERPEGYLIEPAFPLWSYEVSPDSIRGRVRILFDSALVALDTLHFPSFRVERTPEGGVWMFQDSTRVRLMPDSIWTNRNGVLLFPRDSVRFRTDTTIFRGFPELNAFSFRGDSLIRLRTDSVLRGALRGYRPFPDSTFGSRGFYSFSTDSLGHFEFRMPELGRGQVFGLRGDSVFTFEPGGSAGIAVFGMRAVGGAELTELNPDLGEYFGAEKGVLVVRVPDRTPAARAGLEPGDVIVSANGRGISTIAELRRAIGRTSEPVRLDIIRKKARRTIELRED